MTFKTALKATIAGCALLAPAGAAMADQVIITHHGHANAAGIAPKFAMIRRLQTNIHSPDAKSSSFPPTWTFSYTYSGKTYNETFIGTAVSGGATTTVPVYIVPLKLTRGTTSEDPTVVQVNGVSVIQNVLNSPLFQSSVDYKQGGTDLGTTQYEDAFQRAALWGTVKSNPTYHVLLGTPVVEKVQTLKLTAGQGSIQSPFGQSVIVGNINTVDAKINKLIKTLKIPSDSFPMFITTNAYLYSGSYAGGCCIGGYHSVTSAGQPYTHATYITVAGNFAEDIDALSHELGEWIDDPLTNNNSPCGIYEVGDPIEGLSNYGTYPYTVGGVTWHPQDLVLPVYFGAPTSTTVNGFSTFQGEKLAVCSNGS